MLTTILLCSALVRDCSWKSHMPTGDPNKTTASVHAFADLHRSGHHWGSREAWFVDSIADEATVLDLGAGAMHLNVSLAGKRHGIQYLPVDAHDRGTAAMRVCMFNKWEYPVSLVPKPTVIVMQGILEYIIDKAHFLGAFRSAYPSAAILMSYAVGHQTNEYWTAPLTQLQLLEMFHVLGLKVTNHTKSCYPGQDCFKLIVKQVPENKVMYTTLCHGLDVHVATQM